MKDLTGGAALAAAGSESGSVIHDRATSGPGTKAGPSSGV